MKCNLLSLEEVLTGYDAVSKLYPYVPPLLLWRAWEYAAYSRYTLQEPVLDIGCGDGRYFNLVWPDIKHVVGVDQDVGTLERATHFGVYTVLHQAAAHEMPIAAETIQTAFANCALEHMDHIDLVLEKIATTLVPNGSFVFSVVTDKLIEWSTLPLIVNLLGDEQRANDLQKDYIDYHHLMNAFSLEEWAQRLDKAGFDVVEYTPIVPHITSRWFLLLDQFWHVKRPVGEIGDVLYPQLWKIKNFPKSFKKVVEGISLMDQDYSLGSGVVFSARRRS